MGNYHTDVPNPSVPAFFDFAAQARPVRFKSAGEFVPPTLHNDFNPGDVTGGSRDRGLTGRAVLITLSFVEQLCRSVGA